MALLLHGNRLGFNYSVPWEIGIPAIIQQTPLSSPLPTDVWHSLSASPWLRAYSFIPPCSACGMTSLFSGNAQIVKSGIFQALSPPQLHTQFCGDAALPFPAHSDMGPGQSVPGFSTAPPCMIHRILSSLGIPLLSLHLWPCTVIPHLWNGPVQGCTIPFWQVRALFLKHGCSRARPAGGGARGCSTFPKRCAGAVREGGKLIPNPCLCAVTPHVLGFSASPPSRSASGVCNACWLRLAAAGKQCQEKNNSVLLQTSTSRSLAQSPGSPSLSWS